MHAITMVREQSSHDADRILVEIKDADGKRVLREYLSLANFGLVVTGRSEVPFEPKA